MFSLSQKKMTTKDSRKELAVLVCFLGRVFGVTTVLKLHVDKNTLKWKLLFVDQVVLILATALRQILSVPCAL